MLEEQLMEVGHSTQRFLPCVNNGKNRLLACNIRLWEVGRVTVIYRTMRIQYSSIDAEVNVEL